MCGALVLAVGAEDGLVSGFLVGRLCGGVDGRIDPLAFVGKPDGTVKSITSKKKFQYEKSTCGCNELTYANKICRGH